MKTTHTQSPWKAVRVSTGVKFKWVIEGTEYGQTRVLAETKGVELSVLADLFGYIAEEKDDANAKLIAASPELLSIALRFVEGCQNGETVGEKFFSQLYDQANAAISKAHGGYSSVNNEKMRASNLGKLRK